MEGLAKGRVRARRGLSMLEVVIAVGFITLIFVGLFNAFGSSAKNLRHDEMSAAATQAQDNLATDLQAFVMYNIAALGDITVGKTFNVNVGGSSGSGNSAPVAVTVKSITPSGVDNLESTVVFNYTTGAGVTGSFSVTVRQQGVDNGSCNLDSTKGPINTSGCSVAQ